MKNLFLATSLSALFSFAAHGDDRSELRAQISLKEKELTEIQKDLARLKEQLSKALTSTAPTAAIYTVKTGDTIHSIARRHKVSPTALMKWNKITDPTKLGVGETLTISESTGASAPSVTPSTTAKTTSSAASAAASKAYTVAKGDTFYSIARRHKMTLKELKTLNPGVSPHLITVGQSLQVAATPAAPVAKPAPTPPKTYQIKDPVTKPTPSRPSPPPKSSATVALKKSEDTPKPSPKKSAPTPPRPAILDDPKPAPVASTIILDEELTFDEFAKNHGTSTDVLNDLNGWKLPKATVLARGSEIHVPN